MNTAAFEEFKKSAPVPDKIKKATTEVAAFKVNN